MASAQAAGGAAGPGSMAGALPEANARPSLRERVESARRRASERTAHEHNDVLRLTELAHLLDKNKDVARILELIEATGV